MQEILKWCTVVTEVRGAATVIRVPFLLLIRQYVSSQVCCNNLNKLNFVVCLHETFLWVSSAIGSLELRLIIKMMTMIPLRVPCKKAIARAMRAAGRSNARPYKDALLASPNSLH